MRECPTCGRLYCKCPRDADRATTERRRADFTGDDPDFARVEVSVDRMFEDDGGAP